MAKRGRPRKNIASDNAIEILRFDHDRVRDLFERIKNVRGERRRNFIEKVCRELEVYTMVEEEIFYPAVEAEGDETLKTLVSKSLAEHKTIKNLISELKSSASDGREYEEKLRMLEENFEPHAKEEEEALFPDAEKLIGERLDELGREIKDRKQEIAGSRASREAVS